MNAKSKQLLDNQQLQKDILDRLLKMPSYDTLRVESVPARIVKNISMAIRDRNDRGAYDDPPYGQQWNVKMKQSANGDGTMMLTFRKVANHE